MRTYVCVMDLSVNELVFNIPLIFKSIVEELQLNFVDELSINGLINL